MEVLLDMVFFGEGSVGEFRRGVILVNEVLNDLHKSRVKICRIIVEGTVKSFLQLQIPKE